MRTLPLLLLLAGPALAAPPVGPHTQDCIENRDIRARRQSAEDGYFVQTRQGWWRNTAGGCPLYKRNGILVTQSPQNRQCRGDVVQVVDPMLFFTIGSCPLGAWERIEQPPASAKGR